MSFLSFKLFPVLSLLKKDIKSFIENRTLFCFDLASPFFFLLCFLSQGLFHSFYDSNQNRTISCSQIVVEKKTHTMTLFLHSEVYPFSLKAEDWTKTYKVALGMKEGKKEVEGDCKTPEGQYKIKSKNDKSICHKSLLLDYPNSQDRKNARKLGKSPGNAICIHGFRQDIRRRFKNHPQDHNKEDWTHGCIGVTDEEIDEIFSVVKIGTPVKIVP